MHPGSYLREGFNVLDMVVVLATIISFLPAVCEGHTAVTDVTVVTVSSVLAAICEGHTIHRDQAPRSRGGASPAALLLT